MFDIAKSHIFLMFTRHIVRYFTIIMELYHVWMGKVKGEVVKDEIFENIEHLHI